MAPPLPGQEVQVPAFRGRVLGGDGGTRGPVPVLPEGEHERGRFLGDVIGAGELPGRISAPRGGLEPTFGRRFHGVGEFVLGEDRLFGVLFAGQSVAGEFSARAGYMLVFGFAYHDAAALTLERTRSVFGVKSGAVRLAGIDPRTGLRFDVTGSRVRRQSSVRSNGGALTDGLVRLVCASGLHDPKLPRDARATLEATRRGARVEVGDALTAEFR